MTLPLWLGRVVCAWKGKHKRGQRLPRVPEANQDWQTFRCPRCGDEWTRKAAQRKQVAP